MDENKLVTKLNNTKLFNNNYTLVSLEKKELELIKELVNNNNIQKNNTINHNTYNIRFNLKSDVYLTWHTDKNSGVHSDIIIARNIEEAINIMNAKYKTDIVFISIKERKETDKYEISDKYKVTYYYTDGIHESKLRTEIIKINDINNIKNIMYDKYGCNIKIKNIQLI